MSEIETLDEGTQPENVPPETEATSTETDSAAAPAASGDQPRRNFMVEFAAAAIGVIVGVVPAITS